MKISAESGDDRRSADTSNVITPAGGSVDFVHRFLKELSGPPLRRPSQDAVLSGHHIPPAVPKNMPLCWGDSLAIRLGMEPCFSCSASVSCRDYIIRTVKEDGSVVHETP